MNELILRYLGNDFMTTEEADTLNIMLSESAELRQHLLDVALQQECLHEISATEEAPASWWVKSAAIYRTAAVLIIALTTCVVWKQRTPVVTQEVASNSADLFFYPFTHFPFLAASPLDITLAEETTSEAPYQLDLLSAHAYHVPTLLTLLTPNAGLWLPDTHLQ